MQRFVGRAPLLGALVLIVAGCKGDGTGPDSIAGSYRLATVDGAPVPATLAPGVAPDSDRAEMYFGALVLGADGSVRMSVCTRHWKEPTVWVSYSDWKTPTYTRYGDALTLGDAATGKMQARTESGAIAVTYGYNSVVLQLRFERSEPRAPDAEPCL